MTRLGVLTIGQSPRTDVVPDLQRTLGHEVELIEAGALDDISMDEVRELEPGPDDYFLVTRMRTGEEVHVAKRHVVPRLQQQIERLEPQVNAFLMLCTGSLGAFRSSRLVLYPERILQAVVTALGSRMKLGIMTPHEEQAAHQQERWGPLASDVVVAVASPYDPTPSPGDQHIPEPVTTAAHRLKDADVDLVIMDCLGYSVAMKEHVKKLVSRPVLLPRSMLAAVARELL